MSSEEDYASLFRQIIFTDFEVQPAAKTIIIHYKIQVDVLDSKFNVLIEQSKPKTLKLHLNGMESKTDPDEIADICISKCEILKDCKRSQLVKAINDFKNGTARPFSTTVRSPSTEQFVNRNSLSTAPSMAPRSESTPQLKLLSQNENVSQVLHEALQKIHWGDDTEVLLSFAGLADMCSYDKNIMPLIHDEPLMNTLCNGLRKFATSSLPCCIKIMTIFERMSYFKEYQSALARFKVGSMSLNLLHAQLHVTQLAAQKMSKEEVSAYLKQQNHLIRLTVSLLFNISDEISSMRKMVSKGVIEPLTKVLKRKDLEILILALRFLRRISMVNVFWGDVTYDEIVPAIVTDIFRWQSAASEKKTKIVTVLKEALELLYTFSFHPEVIPNFKDSGVFDNFAKLSDLPELRSSLTRLIYQCTLSTDKFDYFRNNTLLDLLIYSATNEGPDHVISLVVLMRLSQDKECSQLIAQSPVFTKENVRTMFIDAANRVGNDSAILLHLIRNIADNQPKLVTGFDDAIVDASLYNKENLEALSDIFAVSSRAKMDSTRAKYFASKPEFVSLVVNILSNPKSLPQLQLECIMFVSSIVLFSAPAQVFESQNIVKHVVNVFMQRSDDLDIQTQCLFCFYRFVCHTETRKALISHNEIVNAIIQHSGSKNQVLASMANSVLEALVTFDRGWAERIRKPRFVAFNKDWIQAIENRDKPNKSPKR